MSYRNDPSSISFGRRMQQLEQVTASQANEIKDLKANGLSAEAVAAGKELAAERRGERQRCNQVLADYNSTMDDLQGLNQSLLTTAQKEQIRYNMQALQAAQFKPAIQFSDDAIRRMDNWRSFVKTNGPQTFADNNLQPEQPKRAFDLWNERQNSPKGKYHNAMQKRAELQQATKQPPKPKKRSPGKTLGSNFGWFVCIGRLYI